MLEQSEILLSKLKWVVSLRRRCGIWWYIHLCVAYGNIIPKLQGVFSLSFSVSISKRSKLKTELCPAWRYINVWMYLAKNMEKEVLLICILGLGWIESWLPWLDIGMLRFDGVGLM